MCAEINNMKLLSICIPTYNRPDKLRELYRSFLSPALDKYGEQIEVVIRDNSDEEHSRLNQAILNSEVHYHKNEKNVGFHNNVIRLVRDATGQFIWVISDDDILLWEGFKRMMDCLPNASSENIDCFMLPFYYRNNLGEVIPPKVGINKDIDIKTFVATSSVVPFGFFAAQVVRLDKKRVDWVAEKYQTENFPIYIPLFLSMLQPGSKLRFHDTPVLEYQEVYNIRGYDILQSYYQIHDVIKFLEEEYDIDGTRLRDYTYKEFLLMIIAHRVGLRIYNNIDETRWPLLAELYKYFNLKSCILALMVASPVLLVKQPYLIYISLDLTDGSFSVRKIISGLKNLSLKGAISRYKVLNRFIRTKENEKRSHK